MARTSTSAALGMTVLCMTAVACAVTDPPASVPRPGRTGTSPSAPSTAADCFLLSRAQMRAAVGTWVSPPNALPTGNCVHRLPRGVGTLDFGVTSFSSSAQARGSLRYKESFDTGVRGMKVAHVKGLGQAAITVTSSLGAEAVVVVGTRELVINISWPHATGQMAITLAREAAKRMTPSKSA